MKLWGNLSFFTLLTLYGLKLQTTEGQTYNAFNATAADVQCFSFEDSCHACIQQPPCKWCAKLKASEQAAHHCFSVNTNLDGICDEVEFPQNSPINFIDDRPLTEVGNNNINYKNIVQLKPQKVSMKLRRGKPINLTLSYRQVKDYPLDLYYLMDLSKSMYDDKITLASLGDRLATRMRTLTSQFKIGFGSFVDKVMSPFVNVHENSLKKPCDDIECATPFSFRNNLQLNENEDLFVKQVKAAKISTNVDLPEGGFDALMQAMVCDRQIGWRENVRKIIIFSTDAESHFAGDGKLAGVITPNDGKCHLNARGEYKDFHIYDYPSVSHLNSVAREKGINIIFAVKSSVLNNYKKLSERIKDSAYGELTDTSDNVIQLVTDVYNNITGKVEIGVKSSHQDSPLSLRFFSDCGKSGQPVRETSVCNNIREGNTFDFTVEVTLLECAEKPKKTSLVIGTLQESVHVEVEPLCKCDCENPNHEGYQPNSNDCSKSGTRQCEVCQCNEGFYGQKCQCRRGQISTGTEDDNSRCRPQASDASESVCSGRGRCECGICFCWKERHHGQFCQCDRGLCRQHANTQVDCSGNGVCNCNACDCNAGWEGDHCQCRTQKSCVPDGGGDLCSGNGECDCGKCTCKVPYTGKYCEDCPTCGTGKCLDFRPCVQCDVWNSGKLSEAECKNCTYKNFPALPSLEEQLNQYALLCTFEDEATGCNFNFTYKYTEHGYEIYAQGVQKCPVKVGMLAVTFGVICGVVAIGVLTLIIWKVLTTIHDRREYMRFESDIKNARWNTEGNPLYKNPTTTISNPAFSSK